MTIHTILKWSVLAVTLSGGLVAGCTDDKPAPDVFVDVGVDASEVAEDIVEDVDEEVIEDIVEDVGPEEVIEDVDGDAVQLTEPGTFVLGTASLPEEYVFKGVWAGAAGRAVAVGNDGVIANLSTSGDWRVLSSSNRTSIYNAISGPNPNQLWAVGSNASIVRGTVDSFNGALPCDSDIDCSDGNSCTINTCVDNICTATSTGAAGCCGTTPGSWDFDTGTMSQWISLAAERIGPWGWHVVSAPARSTSGTYALYFGNSIATPPTYDSPGQHVAGTVTSPSFLLPNSGTANLRFRVFLDAEEDREYDFLSVQVDVAGVRSEVWHKRDLESVPTAGFVEVDADLRQWLGKRITIRVRFDSVDDSSNLFEGAYLDDIRVETTCNGSGAVSTNSGPSLWGVHALSSDFAVAVGQAGTIWQWDGIRWAQPRGADTTASWNAMSGFGDTLALVGSNGIASIATGGNFSPVATNTTFNLNAVHLFDASKVVAVGDSGVVLTGSGTTWTRAQSGVTANLKDVHGVRNDVYAVGVGGAIIHSDGSTWATVVSGTTTNLNAVLRVSETSVIAVGRDGIVVTGNAAEGFAEVTRLAPGLDLNDLWMSADGSMIVAVGQNGRIFEKRGEGDWTSVESPTTQTYDTVWGSSPDNIWIVGRAGTIVHYDGTVAERVESPVTAAINGVWGDADNRFYAAGVGGILLVWDGEKWSAATGGTTENLRGVHVLSRTDGWAVGAKGTLMRFRGLGWAPVKLQTGEDADGLPEYLEDELHAVWTFSSTNAWAVGAGGVIIQWDGAVWTVVETPWTLTLRGLYAMAPNDIWAVGNEGQIVHYNGETWEQIDTGSIATLHAIHGDGQGHVIAVGSLGTVLKLQRD